MPFHKWFQTLADEIRNVALYPKTPLVAKLLKEDSRQVAGGSVMCTAVPDPTVL